MATGVKATNVQRNYRLKLAAGLALLAAVLTVRQNRAAVMVPESPQGISVQVETNGEYLVRGREPG